MLITAVKPPGEWLTTPPILMPSELHWANFTDALFKWGGLKGLGDSLIVASLSTLLSLLFGVPAAYAFGRFNTGGENLSFTVLSILFMPPVAVAIPMYIFWSSLGLLDSYAALILQYTVFNFPSSAGKAGAKAKGGPPTRADVLAALKGLTFQGVA